jgi:hypothetical protein
MNEPIITIFVRHSSDCKYKVTSFLPLLLQD